MNSKLNVVLIEPEIPQNTGSIGRLCLATQTRLHLVGPLGFDLTDSKLKRAGLDYWEHLTVFEYDNLENFLEKHPPEKTEPIFFSKKAAMTHFEINYAPDSFLIFGKETMGLPEWLIQRYPTRTVRIPMFDARVRSLNLSNAVGIGVFEAIRQVRLDLTGKTHPVL